MLAARAFCTARRSAGLVSGLLPPLFTAIAMSLLIRVNSFAILFQRANIVALRVSKIRPMSGRTVTDPRGAGSASDWTVSDHFERARRNGGQRTHLGVVPVRALAADRPVASVVRHDHPVLLERPENDERSTPEAGEVEAGLQANPETHRREVHVGV